MLGGSDSEGGEVTFEAGQEEDPVVRQKRAVARTAVASIVGTFALIGAVLWRRSSVDVSIFWETDVQNTQHKEISNKQRSGK